MAGGKQTPRQKMINLMYLVFIAMMALNMSKEVLTAFGLIDESLTEANESFVSKNQFAVNNLQQKAKDAPDQFEEAATLATSIASLTNTYFEYLGSLKSELKETVKDPTDYETMDKSIYLDEKLMSGGNLTEDGKVFMNQMQTYHDGMVELLSGNIKYDQIKNSIDSKFNGESIVDREGVTKTYIDYHFIGYPLVSSVTKLSSMQNDIKVYENELLSLLLSGELASIAEVNTSNYSTLLESVKSAFFSDENFEGSVVLGRTDETTRPNKVILNLDGRALEEGKDYVIEGGKVQLKMQAGNVGEHNIEGNLIFTQDGVDTEVPVSQKYQVIPKPNQAIVSADKMNVVYRGIKNPITVSMPGVPSNKITASSPQANLNKISGTSYEVVPSTGNELKINVTGEVDGKRITSPPVTFRIKSLPRPTPTVRGEIQEGSAIQMPRNALKISQIGATFENFDFDITPVVKQFTLSIPGQPSMVITGNRLDQRAQGLLDLAKAGDVVQIFDIRADVPGVNVKNMPALLVQITN